MLFEMLLVVAILDGDTIRVLDANHNQLKVRLASIDAPERSQPYGLKSKQLLSSLIGNKKINLDCPATDRYKRLICSISLPDGLDVNAYMVLNGGAWVYRRYYKGTKYLELESIAKTNNYGLWGLGEHMKTPPWEWRRQPK